MTSVASGQRGVIARHRPRPGSGKQECNGGSAQHKESGAQGTAPVVVRVGPPGFPVCGVRTTFTSWRG